MTRKQLIIFLTFLVVSLVVTTRSGLIRSIFSNPTHDREMAALREKFDRLDALKSEQNNVQTQLNEARQKLTGTTRNHLPAVEDPYAWTSLRIHELARTSGVEAEGVTAQTAPSLRVPREGAPRLFKTYRIQTELKGTLVQMATFLELAESQNPHLTISDFYVGPTRVPGGVRQGNAQLDWPMWVAAEKDRVLRSPVETGTEPDQN